MILDNSKIGQKVYIMQDLLQDSKVMTSWEMRGTMMKMQKYYKIIVTIQSHLAK